MLNSCDNILAIIVAQKLERSNYNFHNLNDWKHKNGANAYPVPCNCLKSFALVFARGDTCLIAKRGW